MTVSDEEELASPLGTFGIVFSVCACGGDFDLDPRDDDLDLLPDGERLRRTYMGSANLGGGGGPGIMYGIGRTLGGGGEKNRGRTMTGGGGGA